MNTLVLYESKHGATKSCAKYINDNIEQSEMVRAREWNGPLNDYDQIIIGSSIYVGQFNKHIKTFLTSHKDELLQKPLLIFYCGMNVEEHSNVLKTQLDPELLDHASIMYGGGAYDFKNMNFLERFIVKKIAKVSESTNQIKYDNLDEIIKKANR